MTIRKGEPWGAPGALSPDGVVVRSDAEASAVVTAARLAGVPPPAIGLLAGDLCRTLGGRGDEARLRSDAAMTFPVDLGVVETDAGRWWFVAHAVARNRTWTRVVAALNAQWVGPWNAGPRAHPDDGLLDVYDATLPIGEVPKVRARLPAGAHLPHPGIRERRVPAVEIALSRPLNLWVDGARVGRARHLRFAVEPDALRIVV